MKTSLLVLFLCMLGQATTLAAEPYLRLGTYSGRWGGILCTYVLTSKEKHQNVFHGTVYLKATNQTDNIKIEQFADNALAMTRFLQGKEAGKTQWVMTTPPRAQQSSYFFVSKARGGPGMQGTAVGSSSLLLPK